MITAGKIIDRLFGDTDLSSNKAESLRTQALGWCNRGQEDIAKHTYCLESQAIMNTAEGKKQYPLPGKPPITDCLAIKQVLLGGTELQPKTLTELVLLYTDWTTTNGTPKYYLPRMSGFQWRLWLIPIPTSNNDTLTIFYFRKPKELVKTNQGIVIDTELLLRFLKWQLYEHLANGDPEKYSIKANQFQVQYLSERESLKPTLRVKQVQKFRPIRKVWP